MTEKAVKLKTPLTQKDILSLNAGDHVSITGKLVTARDRACKLFAEKGAPVDLKGAALYNCGPIAAKEGKEWRMVAAGPTTSARIEDFVPALVEKFGVKMILGKGGMGSLALEAMRGKCVYVNEVGGSSVLLAKHVKKVLGVHYLEEFGMVDAVWELEVEDFPGMVTMDAHGNSWHEKIKEESRRNLEKLLR